MLEHVAGASRAALERPGTGRAARRGADGGALDRLPGRAGEAGARAVRRVPLHPHAPHGQRRGSAREDRRAARRTLLGCDPGAPTPCTRPALLYSAVIYLCLNVLLLFCLCPRSGPVLSRPVPSHHFPSSPPAHLRSMHLNISVHVRVQYLHYSRALWT